jgi:hypothetical protein
VFGILFLHSELDMFSPKQHLHDSHDFCDIVDNAKIEKPDFVKNNEFSHDVSITSLYSLVSLSYDPYPLKTYNSNKPIIDVDANILYNTFLI